MENSEFFLRGIDVSEWQGEINWKKVAESGIDFAMIRATHGLKRDVYFERNIRGASEAGIAVGVYCCSYALDEESIEAEAAYFVATIKPWKQLITYPAVLDAESDKQFQLGRKTVTAMMLKFCEMVEDGGYVPMVYTNSNWLNNVIDKNALANEGIDIWVSWPKNVTTFEEKGADGVTKHEHTMWQFTDKGKVNGIAGPVDLNVAYIDYAAFLEMENESEKYITWSEVAAILEERGVKGIIL